MPQTKPNLWGLLVSTLEDIARGPDPHTLYQQTQSLISHIERTSCPNFRQLLILQPLQLALPNQERSCGVLPLRDDIHKPLSPHYEEQSAMKEENFFSSSRSVLFINYSYAIRADSGQISFTIPAAIAGVTRKD